MSIVLTSAQMRAVENDAIASGAVTGLELMERAGQAVVDAIIASWPAARPLSGRAMIFCGPGNNGGDGFVIARLLHDQGWSVDVFLTGDPARLPADARINRDRWLQLGPIRDPAACDPWDTRPDLVVDALLGTGISRPISGPMLAALEKLSEAVALAEVLSLAVDLPSGLCADSGKAFGNLIAVDLTVTFGFFKCGHFLADGPSFSGRLVCCDIGLDPQAPSRLFRRSYTNGRHGEYDMSALIRIEDGRSLRPGFSGRKGRLDKGWQDTGGHKFSHGHALVAGGAAGRSGAARLSARSALRIGAGLVTLASPPEAMAENAARLDAIMLSPVADPAALTALLEDPRINALCIGPALGTGSREAGLLRAVLDTGRPAVLDADALTLLAGHPDLFARLHKDMVLTPHGGEFVRLFPEIAAQLTAPPGPAPACSRIDAARAAARQAGCIVLLKGRDTVIADPAGAVVINSAAYGREAPWLATAGSGDVLAGIITGVLARGIGAFEAACLGAWLHVEAARSFGPGLIAEDLPEALPKVLSATGRWSGPQAAFGPPPAGVIVSG
ncbi:NAD(P)H-hydrate dehydratase [Rhodobacter sp. 24-YEA-8]|uniref:NAD(P)H-hydrate dehydratase n=1 Tax=Rhodobacter sp. 24-YEA-8 TaxID=1884310 RepID=UPI00089A35EA|nr:NAD(P)H-hydrate dehydratase [Rhodobacter sp. 24-YEA-8]SEB58806.1 yjeF C-terminal region, hydroxyethylthiazole kinase-related/yjeF N-terminal region [Rhodobacter sp. 24-YEA-8]